MVYCKKMHLHYSSLKKDYCPPQLSTGHKLLKRYMSQHLILHMFPDFDKIILTTKIKANTVFYDIILLRL